MRITLEAKEQGGLLSQEGLSKLLMCDVRTIRRDIKDLKKIAIIVPTRGQSKILGQVSLIKDKPFVFGSRVKNPRKLL